MNVLKGKKPVQKRDTVTAIWGQQEHQQSASDGKKMGIKRKIKRRSFNVCKYKYENDACNAHCIQSDQKYNKYVLGCFQFFFILYLYEYVLINFVL